MKSSWSQEIFVKRNNNNKKIQLTRKSVLQPQTTMIPVQKKGRNKKYRCNLMSTVFSVVLYSDTWSFKDNSVLRSRL